MLTNDVGIVLPGGAAKSFKNHDEQDDTDARPSHHAGRGNAPLRREEAGVDGVPVPQHLDIVRNRAACEAVILTEILQEGPSPIPIPIPPMSMLDDSDAIAAAEVALILIPLMTLMSCVVDVGILIAMDDDESMFMVAVFVAIF